MRPYKFISSVDSKPTAYVVKATFEDRCPARESREALWKASDEPGTGVVRL